MIGEMGALSTVDFRGRDYTIATRAEAVKRRRGIPAMRRWVGNRYDAG